MNITPEQSRRAWRRIAETETPKVVSEKDREYSPVARVKRPWWLDEAIEMRRRHVPFPKVEEMAGVSSKTIRKYMSGYTCSGKKIEFIEDEK